LRAPFALWQHGHVHREQLVTPVKNFHGSLWIPRRSALIGASEAAEAPPGTASTIETCEEFAKARSPEPTSLESIMSHFHFHRGEVRSARSLQRQIPKGRWFRGHYRPAMPKAYWVAIQAHLSDQKTLLGMFQKTPLDSHPIPSSFHP